VPRGREQVCINSNKLNEAMRIVERAVGYQDISRKQLSGSDSDEGEAVVACIWMST
jgi:hypothetical protein